MLNRWQNNLKNVLLFSNWVKLNYIKYIEMKSKFKNINKNWFKKNKQKKNSMATISWYDLLYRS